MFEIEKGIPIPAARKRKYPFAEIKVGDSFFVPLDGVDPDTIQRRVCASWQKQDGKFRSVKEDDGIRVWRIR